jgi:uncharacterized coiled-coil DUF342 family protein
MKIEIITGADNNPVAEFFSSSSTPETDAFIASQNHSPTTHQLRNFARIFEMQRDEAREERDKLKQLLAADSENVDAYLGVCIERDEARSVADGLAEQAERLRKERDEAHDELSNIRLNLGEDAEGYTLLHAVAALQNERDELHYKLQDAKQSLEVALQELSSTNK